MPALAVEDGVVGLDGGEAVDVAVVHAEGSGDEDGVVDFEVGGAEAARVGYVVGGHVFAAVLDFGGDDEERFEFVGNVRVLEITLDAFD